MKDNVSAGVFSSNLNHNLGLFIGETLKNTLSLAVGSWEVSTEEAMASNLLTGAKQDWFMFPVDPLTGMLYSMSFGVGFLEGDVYAVNSMQEFNYYDISAAQLLPLMDVVLEKTNGDSIYFGKVDDNGNAVGLGYPRLSFTKKDNEGRYMVDFSNKDYPYTYGECVIGYEPRSFATVDGDILPKRNKVIEFASAKFVGKETENSEESDTCVFKDGKERIVSTIQFEPVNEDGSVMFSPYMMKLSDAMGGLEKNYDEDKIVSEMRFMFGTVNITIKKGYREDYFNKSAAFSVPTLTIAVPHGYKNPNPINLNKTFTINGKDTDGNDISYSISISQAVVDYVNQEIKAQCSITTVDPNANQFNGILVFKLLIPNSIIYGRNGSSNFPSSAGFDMGIDYDSYAMFDDACFWYLGGFNGDERLLATFKQTLLNADKVPYEPDEFDWATNAPYSLFKHKRSTSLTPYEFSDCPLYTNGVNFKNISIECVGTSDLGPNLSSWSEIIQSFNQSIVESGPSVDETLVKRKNMFWCICPVMDRETPYSVLNAEPSNLINPNISIQRSAKGIYEMVFAIPTKIETTCSLCLYYLDQDGKYHFVFGINIAPPVPEGSVMQEQMNMAYPVAHLTNLFVYRIFVSFVDNRSKTVINNIQWNFSQGDPTFKVANYADDSETPPDETGYPYNKCVAK